MTDSPYFFTSPAYPVVELHNVTGDVCAQHMGASMLDYFAARAPAEVPTWFSPVVPPIPVRKWVGEDGTEYPSEWHAERACGDCFRDANQDQRTAWLFEHERQRVAQWPWAWADLVLKARQP